MNNPLLVAFGVAGMILLSGLFSALEIAFLSASKSRLYEKARTGNKSAGIALNLLKDTDKLLASMVLLINTANVASASLTTALMLKLFGEVGIAYATGAMSIIVLLLAEALPKAIGARAPDSLTLAFARFIKLIVNILSPLTAAIHLFNHGMLWLVGAHNKRNEGLTESDIRGAINLGLEYGAIAKNQHRMMDAVLDLDDLTAADVMVHRSSIVGLNVNTPPRQIPEKITQTSHTRIPVYEGTPDTIIGFLNARDYLAALAKTSNPEDIKIRPLLRPTYFIPETTPIAHQLKEFLRSQRHIALVVDEYGDIQGLLTLEDILEEIVGEIADENETSPAAEKQADGSFIFSGRHPVRDANRAHGWYLPDENAVTLAGLMADLLGHLPSQGESVTCEGLILTAIAKRGHRIEKVRITAAKPKPSKKKEG